MTATNSKKRKLEETSLAPTREIAPAPTRRHFDISGLIQFLEKARGTKEKRARPRRADRIRVRTAYSENKKALVVYLRFGTLTEEAPPRMPMAQVRDIAGVKLHSCYSIIRDWRKKGHVISNGRVGERRRTKVSKELEAQLVAAATLHDMAPHSLESRVILIEQQFGVKITAHHLWHIYRRNKVRFVKPQYSYCRKEVRRDELYDEQQRVSMEIAELMARGKHLIYLDESSFHQWLVPSRAWVRKDMALKMPSTRGRSMTIIAAISERVGLAHFQILRGRNDTASFQKFVQELVRNTKGDAIVYMDNYSVHYAKPVREFFNERIQQRFLPAYSCALNPIEKLWMLVKGQWRKKMLAHPEGVSEDEMETTLRGIMLSLSE